MEALLNEMRQAASKGELETLTVDIARSLQGKKIQTIYFGYKGQDGVDEFIVGELKTKYEIAQEQQVEGFESRADGWDKRMRPAQLEAVKSQIQLITEDGRNTYISSTPWESKFADGAMWCSDADRFVLFRII